MAISPNKKNTIRPKKPHNENLSVWQCAEQLFSQPNPAAASALNELPKALAQVWPLNAKHKRSLPGDISGLSQILTCQRAGLKTPYWLKPQYLSAYLYYFLPWNLLRLTELLQNLPLPEPRTQNNALPLLLDAGSGPLTLPIALWLAKPQWRQLPLTVFALDAARKPLELGAALFKSLGQILAQPVWNIKTASGSIHNLAKQAPKQNAAGQNFYPWLASAANVLNELRPDRRIFDGEETPAENALENLLAAWEPINGAPLLFVEPGTRLGGTTIMQLRQVALENDFFAISPCCHNQPCPLLKSGKSGLADAWCHFVFSAQAAPAWLADLTTHANLGKTTLTVAPLLLSPKKRSRPSAAMPCRVISQAFATPLGKSRYGCAAPGLCLLPNCGQLVSGSLTLAQKPDAKNPRDAKSGAIILAPTRKSE